MQVGLKRSTLVREELERAQEGNILSRTTLSLFYATDFADQLENIILPALKAGFIVLAAFFTTGFWAVGQLTRGHSAETLLRKELDRGIDDCGAAFLSGKTGGRHKVSNH